MSLHARRQLIGKELRYLKRVTVTPSLHWCLAWLNPGLTNQQWEGLSDCTRPYDLAIGCVFAKQSGSSRHCDLRWRALEAYQNRHAFSRSYGANLPISFALIVPDTPYPTRAGTPVPDLGTNIRTCCMLSFTGSWTQPKPGLRPAP